MAYVGKDGAIYKDYNSMRKSNAKYDLLDKQNKLIQRQNELMQNNFNNYYNNYTYNRPTQDISTLGLLATLSIIPIALGFILTFLVPGDDSAKPLGIKLLLAGSVCPLLEILMIIFKTKKKSNKK